MSAWPHLRNLERSHEHSRDIFLLAQHLGNGGTICIRWKCLERRICRTELEQLDASLIGQQRLCKALSSQRTHAIIRLVSRERYQGDPAVWREIQSCGHLGVLGGAG